MSSVFAKLNKINPFIFVSALYLLMIIIVWPVGNFPINDDWLFVRQIQAFLQGQKEINILIDPIFIFQGALGYIWASIISAFGFSLDFFVLRILSVLVTLLFLFGIYKILVLLKLNRTLTLITLTTFVINPVIFHSSLSFMTESYFLAVFVWSIYFYLKWFQNKSLRINLLLGSIFCAFAFLTRQIGLGLILAVFPFVLFHYYKSSSQKKAFNLVFDLVYLIFPVVFGVLIWQFWPTFQTLHTSSFWDDVVSAENLVIRIQKLYFVLPYIAFFASPLLFPYFFSLSKKLKIFLAILGFFLLIPIFQIDIFAMGNVFYLEGLHAKSNFRSNFSIFDNSLLKLLIGYFVVLNLLSFGTLVVNKLKDFSLKKVVPLDLFLVILSLGMFFTIIISTDYYERYLLPMFVPLLILLAKSVQINFAKRIYLYLAFASTATILFITLTLNFEYFRMQNLKWEQANKIYLEFGHLQSIYVDGVYERYTKALKSNDFSGLKDGSSPGDFNCYVQEYTLDATNPVFLTLENGIEKFQQFVPNPKIYESTKDRKIPRIKKRLDSLIYNEEYTSLLYNLVGKKAYVGTWCKSDSE